MADGAEQDRTEEPTPRRREEAREKGSVAKSQELNSVAVLISAMLAFKAASGLFGRTVREFLVTTYHESSFMELTVQTLPHQLMDFGKIFAMIVMPVMLFILVGSLAANVAQTGFLMAKKALKPDFKKLNPLSGIKKMFSSRSLVELAKGLFKIVILALIGYWVISKYQDNFLLLPNQTAAEIITFTAKILYELTFKVGIALLIMALADYAYQRFQHEKSLKMTKQEIKDEHKQHEGDPRIKGHIKSMQIKMATQRMMQDVPEATVVVTNPTHIAIALKYEPKSSSDAPVVVAKGKEQVAQRIKKIAREHGVPVIENKPLARGLFDVCEVGMEIPMAFYQAVAEVLSQVYQSQKGMMPKLGELNG